MRKRILSLVIIFGTILCSVSSAQSKEYVGAVNGSWGSSANWSPSGVPTLDDDVLIPAGKTVNINYSATNPANNIRVCKSLRIESGYYEIAEDDEVIIVLGDAKLNINGATSLTVLNNCEIVSPESGAVSTLYVSSQSSITINGGLSINVNNNAEGLINNAGTLNLSGNFVIEDNRGTLSGNGIFNFNGSGDQLAVVSGGINSINYSTLNIDKLSGVVTFVNATNEISGYSITSALNIKSGTLSNNGKRLIGEFGANLSIDANAKLLLMDTTGFPAFTGTKTLAANSIVEFGGTNQSVTLPAGSTPNLTLSGSGTKLLSGSIAVNNLDIQSGASFFAGGNSITLNGNFVNNGTFNAGLSTVNVTGATSAISGISQLNHLSIANGAALTFPTVLSFTGNLDVLGTADFSASSLTFNGLDAQQISGVSSVKDLTVNKTGNLTLSNPIVVSGILDLANGNLESNGNLTVNLNTGYVSTNNGGSVTGDVTFVKTVAHDKSSFMSSPVTTTASDFGGPVTIYDEGKTSGRYVLQAGATPVGPTGVGYSVNYGTSSPTVNLSGSYNNGIQGATATIKSTKSGGSSRAGWNIIGNPYPHDLDWNAIVSHNDLSNSSVPLYSGIYYYIGNDNFSSYVNNIPANLRMIPAMQGVMVYLHNASAGNTTFSLELPRSAGSNSVSSLKRVAEITDVLKIDVQSGLNKDATYIRLSDDATENFDGNFDAYKMKNGGATTPNIYTYNSKDIFSINSVPATFDQYSIPMAFEAKVNGEYTLTLSEEYEFTLGYNIVLEDRLLGTFVPFGDEREYKFLASTSDKAGRFVLHFSIPVITNINPSAFSKSVKVFVNGNDLVLSGSKFEEKASVSIFDVKGSLIKSYEGVDLSSGNVRLVAPTQNGLYIVKITSAEYISSEKIVINQ